MNILKNEICKLFTRRTVPVLLLLIALNLLIQLYSFKTPGEEFYTPRSTVPCTGK